VVKEKFTSGFILTSEGSREPVIPPKIVGGENETEGQFPHHVTVLIGRSFWCGGSLIAREWVLTAARYIYE
jgi:secreted trypsin-like serine protease